MANAPNIAPLDLARLYLKMTDFGHALEVLEPLIATARQGEDWPTYLQAVPLRLRVFAEQMCFADIHQQVVELEQLQSRLQPTAELLYTLGICDAYAGRTASAETHFLETKQVAEAHNEPKWLAHALGGLALCYCHSGQLDRALELTRNARDLLDSLQDADLSISFELTVALIHREKQQFDLAFEALERVQKKLMLDGNWYTKVNVIHISGTIYQKMGESDRAELYLQLAKGMIDQNQLKHLSNQIDLRLLELRQASQKQFDIVWSREPYLRVHERSKGTINFGQQLVLFDLLSLFLEQPGRVFSKEDLVRKIWNETYDPSRHDNKLFVTMRRLRKLIEVDGRKPRYILRARGGYYFNKEMRVRGEPS